MNKFVYKHPWTHFEVNNPVLFRAKSTARAAYHQLPEFLQLPIRRVVQGARGRRLAENLPDD